MAKRSFPNVFVSVFAAASITAILMLITLGSFSHVQVDSDYAQSLVENEYDNKN